MPAKPSDKTAVYAFDDFVVDSGQGTLQHGESVVPLPSRAFDALMYLIEHRDRSVPKDELIRAIWQDVIVTEDSLVHAISVLRRTLGDERQDPTYIQTVPRRGYRFIAPVRQPDAPDVPPDLPRSPGSPPSGPAPSAPGAAGSTRSRPGPIGASVLASMAVALVVSIGFQVWRDPPRPDTPGTRLTLYQPAPDNTEIVSGGVLSPNDRYLAFVAQNETTGEQALWLKTLDSDELRPLAGTGGADKPFWSPDSQRIAFFAGGELRAVDIAGGSPRTIAPVFAAAGGSWGPDDSILYAEWNAGVFIVPASGDGGPEPVVALDRDAGDIAYAWPQFFRDSGRFVYQVVSLTPGRSGIHVGELASGDSFLLLETDSAATLAPPNYLLHVENGMLIAEEIDPEGLGLTGRAIVVAREVAVPTVAGGSILSASNDLLAFQHGKARPGLAWYERDGTLASALRVPTALYNPRLSPDGSRLAGTGAVTTDPGLWLVNLEREEYLRLDTDALGPVWSPDGSRLAFASRDGFAIYLRALDEPAGRREVLADGAVKILNDWSPDGRELLFTRFEPGNDLDLWTIDLATGAARPLLTSPHSETQARISPDGHWIAYASDESGGYQVYVARYPALDQRRMISIEGGGQPQWRADQSEIYFLAADRKLVAVAVHAARDPDAGSAGTAGPALEFDPPRSLFRVAIDGDVGDAREHYAAAAGGDAFLVAGANGDREARAITVMVNWAGDLPDASLERSDRVDH